MKFFSSIFKKKSKLRLIDSTYDKDSNSYEIVVEATSVDKGWIDRVYIARSQLINLFKLVYYRHPQIAIKLVPKEFPITTLGVYKVGNNRLWIVAPEDDISKLTN
jgi:hypothetical protein